jgi:hypothetical protein
MERQAAAGLGQVSVRRAVRSKQCPQDGLSAKPIAFASGHGMGFAALNPSYKRDHYVLRVTATRFSRQRCNSRSRNTRMKPGGSTP